MSAKPLPFIRPGALDAGAEALRVEVREFIKHELSGYPPRLRAKNWTEHNATFSAKLGARGWIGLTWPKRYGGADRSHLERYVLIEELLAAGAPVGAHWIADRQSGPMLMRYSPEVWAPRICPGIARGEIFFCIGMSEPDSGSDLASVRSRARRVDGGWLLNGRKVWTSRAHQSHYMIALFRTGDAGQSRHGGLSQFLVDLKSPSITIRPIQNPLGEHEFNEVTFDDLLLPDECLLGEEGDGWAQVTAELSFERSGPERYLSSTQLLLEMLDLADAGSERDAIALGRLTAQFATAEPCMPSQRIESGCVSGNPPMPMSVVVTGICVASANFLSSAAAPLEMMPPPQ